MNNILNRYDLANYYGEIELCDKKRTLPIIILLLGVALLVVAILIKENEDLGTLLLTLGLVCAGVGIVKIIRPGIRITHSATGETIVRHEYTLEQENQAKAEELLRNGNHEALKALSKANSPLLVVTYSTHSGSLFIGQILHYVPYEYQPLAEPIVIKK